MITDAFQEDNQALIFDVKHYAVHDGPGIRTAFFIKGCPMRCKWCQNPESSIEEKLLVYNRLKCIGCGECRSVCGFIGSDFLVNNEECASCGKCIKACKPGARFFDAKMMGANDIVSLAKKEKIYFDISGGGVTLSGGECLLHPFFVSEVLQGLKQAGIHTIVDTCGFVPCSAFDLVLPHTDLFLYDIKKIDPKAHKDLTGVDNTIILDNLKYICEKGAAVIIRVPLIPGFTDSRDDIQAVAEFVKRELQGAVQRIELLPYNKLAESKYLNNTAWRDPKICAYTLKGLEPQSSEYVDGLLEILKSTDIPCFAERL